MEEIKETIHWICEYWARHIVNNWSCSKCTCFDRIAIHPKEYYERMKELGFKINHPSDVTDVMMRSYKATYLVNWEYVWKKEFQRK